MGSTCIYEETINVSVSEETINVTVENFSSGEITPLTPESIGSIIAASDENLDPGELDNLALESGGILRRLPWPNLLATAKTYFDGLYMAIGAMTAHLTAFTHSDIAHANRAALDQVSGTNTGDQDLSGYATTTALTNASTADRDRANHTGSQLLATISDAGTAAAEDVIAFEPRRLHNLTATTDPTVNDDDTTGYVALSKWVNTVTGEVFVCLDATTGAATWALATLTIDDLGSAATAETTDFAPALGVDDNYVTGDEKGDLHAPGSDDQVVDGETITGAGTVEDPWVAVGGGGGGGRELLTADRTYYVRVDGSDSNDGLTDSAEGAFLTMQYASDLVTSTLDVAGYIVTIQCGPGTYVSATASTVLDGFVGGGTVQFIGDTTTPSNCIINNSGNGFSAVAAAPGTYFFDGFKFTCPTGFYNASPNMICTTGDNMEFACSAAMFIVYAVGAKINAGSFTTSGNAARGIFVGYGGNFACIGKTITIIGTPSYSSAFVGVETGAIARISAFTIIGSATGKKHDIRENAILKTYGAYASLPGSVAGTEVTGGQVS
jgi:hypothetical protein